jgi:uncharacterized protein YggT (Ycf19 family)
MHGDGMEMRGLWLANLVVWSVYAVVFVAEIVLAFAFVLMLFAARTSAPFTRWIYRSERYVMGPFRGIFPVVRENGSVLNFSILFAMMVYGLLALIIESVAEWLDAAVRRMQLDASIRQRQGQAMGTRV